MQGVAETDTEAVRQHWWAASAVLALAVTGLTVFQLAPGARFLAEIAYVLAFAVAGFAATRLMLPDGGNGVLRRLVEAWAAAVRWGLPGLVTVMIAVLAVSAILLSPADLMNQAWTALWTALGAGGWQLMKQGVPDPAMSGELLLHLWAPGVALQLFAGWTVAMAVMIRLRLTRWVGAFAALGVLLSLALELWLREQAMHPQAFYLAPANAWPFLIGAVVAGLPAPPAAANPVWRTALARLGELVWPFHLWFWPLATLPRLILARPLTPIEVVAVLIAAGLLALATRRWIERPIRRRLAGRPIAALAAAVVSFGVLALISGLLFVADGLPGRADPGILAEQAAVVHGSPLHGVCHVEGERTPPVPACTTPPGGAADVVVWGNSHAAHLTPAILDWTTRHGLRMRQVTKSGCLPVLETADGLASDGCLAFNRAAVREMGEGPRPRLVILGAAWTVILSRSAGDDREGTVGLERDLAATVRRVRAAVGPEAGIVLIGTTPDFGFAPAACHWRRRFLGLDTERCDLAPAANAATAAVMDGALARIAAEQPGVHVFDPAAALCRDSLCRTRGPDGPWYADNHHLTPSGGRVQSASLATVLDRASARP